MGAGGGRGAGYCGRRAAGGGQAAEAGLREQGAPAASARPLWLAVRSERPPREARARDAWSGVGRDGRAAPRGRGRRGRCGGVAAAAIAEPVSSAGSGGGRGPSAGASGCRAGGARGRAERPSPREARVPAPRRPREGSEPGQGLFPHEDGPGAGVGAKTCTCARGFCCALRSCTGSVCLGGAGGMAPGNAGGVVRAPECRLRRRVDAFRSPGRQACLGAALLCLRGS